MNDFDKVCKVLKARYLKNKPVFDAKAQQLKKQNDREFSKFIARMKQKTKKAAR